MPAPLILGRKISQTILLVTATIGALLSLQFHFPAQKSFSGATDAYFLKQLQATKASIFSLRNSSHQRKDLQLLQKQFFQSRLAFKKLAVLVDYFNPYEAKLLNGPALDRVIEDNPASILPPQGYQAVEQLLFSDWKKNSYDQLNGLVDDMLRSIKLIENEKERINKFKPALVWDALRSSVVRLALTGITGFDSPVAKNSIPEATATGEAIQELLVLFKKEFHVSGSNDFHYLFNLMEKKQKYLSSNKNFNSFNRFLFITTCINPLYQQLLKTRLSCSIDIPQGSLPIDPYCGSIFSPQFMNINFFAPGNNYSVTDDRVVLGKKLFSDPVLSATHTRSCASCHNPASAFTDGLKTPGSIGENTSLTRNTPTLLYSGLQSKFFFDSRADNLENQLDEVIHNAKEMKGSLKNSAVDLKKDPMYRELFQKAYSNLKEPVSVYTIANAISSYVRTLTPFSSRFDEAMQGDVEALTGDEKNGFNLFAGKAKCATCHFMPLFNGLVPPQFTESESEIIGVPQFVQKKPAVLDPDLGKFLFTTSPIHKYSFKTPTLRNISLTAPYMHNGVYKTLEEVMEFYNNGGGKGLHITPQYQTLPFDKLHLSKKEINDIIAFMKALTDNFPKSK